METWHEAAWAVAHHEPRGQGRGTPLLLGVPDNEPLPLAVEKMNFIMGINGAGPLPKQVDELVRETGVTAAPADAPAAPEAKKHSGCSVEFKKALRPAKFCFLNAAPRL